MSQSKRVSFSRCAFITAALVLAQVGSTAASPGDVDPLFGEDGTATADIGRTSAAAGGVLIQPDGRIIAVGTVATNPSGGRGLVLARFETDGGLDASWGHDGVATDRIGDSNAAEIQDDGKVVVVGGGRTSFNAFLVARYTSSGALDPSFGEGGVSLIETKDRSIYEATDVALQADGGIVVVGVGGGRVVVVRVDRGGALDPSFGDGGRKIIQLPWYGWDQPRLALQDDKILVGGSILRRDQPDQRDLAIVRLNADGSRDLTFGKNGVATMDLIDFADIAVQPNRAIVVVGGVSTPRSVRGDGLILLRLGANGRPDRSFGARGSIVERTARGVGPTALAIQPDGRILVSAVLDTPAFELLRYRPNGKRDSDFDLDGRLSTRIEKGARAADVAVGPHGEIVVSGSSNRRADGTTNMTVARYDTRGARDLGFGPRGFRILPVFVADDRVSGVVTLPSGEIVVAGDTWGSATNQDVAVFRIAVDGTPDAGFGSNGVSRIDTTPIDSYDDTHEDRVNAMAVQPDGRVVLAGSTHDGHEYFQLVRLTAIGALDSSFGGDGAVVIGAGWDATVTAVAVQPSGKIVFGGSVCDDFNPCWREIRRLLSDGSSDLSFADAGKIVLPSEALALALGRNGELLVGMDGGLARFDADGAPDPGFGDDGFVPLAIGKSEFRIGTLAERQDGGLVAGLSLADDFTVIAVDASGTPDPDFGDDGVVTTDFGGNREWITSLALESDGKLVVAGTSQLDSETKRIVARYSPDGSLDASFGNGGSIFLPGSPADDLAPRVAIGADGAIYVATKVKRESDFDFSVLRLEGDSASHCGNGLIEPAELCDDGNAADGDGCSAICGIEPCFRCTSEPSTCLAAVDEDPACDPRPTCPVPGDPDFLDLDADGRDGACDLCPEIATRIDDDSDRDGIGNECDLCPDSFDTTNADDGDAVGEVCDPCTGGPPLEEARLAIRSLDSGRGDKRVKLRGTFDLPLGTALEPDVGAIEIVVADASKSLFGAWTLQGSYDPVTGGWHSHDGGSAWQFDSGTARSPIIRASLQRDPEDAQRILLSLLVKRAEIGTPPLRFPLRATVRYRIESFAQCSKAVFDESSTVGSP